MTSAPAPASREQILEYVEEMLLELAGLAEGAGEKTLGAGIRLLAVQAARRLEQAT